jgi:hypothetical protein
MGSCGGDALHCGHLRYLTLNDDESMYACYCQESLSPRRILALALNFEYLCWTIGFCFILSFVTLGLTCGHWIYVYVSGSEIIYWTKVKHYPVSNGFCNAITMFKHSSE